jgi:YD repeat-containing protein
MSRRHLVLFAAIAIFIQILAAPKASAQTTDPCVSLPTIWFFPDPIPVGYWYWGPGEGPYSINIAAKKCSPPPECHCSPPAPNAAGGAPIDFATGDTIIQSADFSIPGLGGGLTLQRTWNGLWPTSEVTSSIGIFGQNWRSTYEERVFMGGDNYLKYSRNDGNYWSFGLSGVNTFVPVSPANVSATLSQPSYTLLKFQNGEQRQFDPTTGLLTAIVDRNGNTTQLTYDSSNRLVTVTDPASRHLYFNHVNGSTLVTSITSDFGISLSYAYDSSRRLSQVTRPDLTTITYTYNSQSQITQVSDSNGKVLESHTYDSLGHGLTSSQANGVNLLTVITPPVFPPMNSYP